MLGLLCRSTVVFVALGALRIHAAPFVNLNFEQATVPPGTMKFLDASLAFPGWTPAIGGVPLNVVHYNNPGIGEGAVVLYDEPLFIGGYHVIEGVYSVALLTDHGFNLVASLSQTVMSLSVRARCDSWQRMPSARHEFSSTTLS